MNRAEKENMLALTETVNDMKYDFAEQEAFFLHGKWGKVRLEAHEKGICWIQKECDHASRKDEIDRLLEDIQLKQSLCNAIVECNYLRQSDPERYREEQRIAYKTAQFMNFGLFAVNRTIQHLKFRPECPDVIKDVTKRYINTVEAEKDVVWQITYMRHHLHCALKANPKNVRLMAAEWIEEKFS